MSLASTFHCTLERTAVASGQTTNRPAALNAELERAVQRVVRRLIRRGETDSLPGDRVMATAESLVRQSSMLRIDRDRLVTRVARRLCELLEQQAQNELDHLLGRRIAAS